MSPRKRPPKPRATGHAAPPSNWPVRPPDPLTYTGSPANLLARTSRVQPWHPSRAVRRDLDVELLARIHAAMPELEATLAYPLIAGAREEAMFRLYHGSYKVYPLQQLTLRIVGVLERLAPPGADLSPWFREIVADGTGLEFTLAHNETWPNPARRVVEAFLHAHFFLDAAARYGRAFATAPNPMPGGWAAVLELYGAL
jgi:hypothetical protein